MTTIKIKPSHPSQGEFVIIDRADFDPAKHELYEGESLGDEAGTAQGVGEGIPTLGDLMAATKQLQARKDELDDRELALSQRAAALDEREAALNEQAGANAAEAQRLADLATAQAAANVDPATMTKAQLQAALEAKGIEYPAAADKAALLTLLTAA